MGHPLLRATLILWDDAGLRALSRREVFGAVVEARGSRGELCLHKG